MNRFHVHLNVADIDASIRFYTALFASEPSVRKPDYAKWMLEDPRVNFAISQRGRAPGVNHLGFQVDTGEELVALREQVAQADIAAFDQPAAACCYARSDKYWTEDPQGVAWETFHTLGNVPVYGENAQRPDAGPGASCVPSQAAGASCC
jgi:catechol 2,3-dioxygenase-like lactoylglutathione lyase family enzyme